jgi:hypothetical protein
MLQNRVNPWGQLVAVADRGTLMGNRGILHNEHKQIVRKWAHKSWVCCSVKFGDLVRPKPFSTPNNYSELFFLDEATAFAAGHRPCNFCRRERTQAFKSAWVGANRPGPLPVSLKDIDTVMHRERTARSGEKLTFREQLSELPVGAMFALGETAYVVSDHGFLPWSFAGYGQPQELDPGQAVDVLTPRSVVNAFGAGYVPVLHASAH